MSLTELRIETIYIYKIDGTISFEHFVSTKYVRVDFMIFFSISPLKKKQKFLKKIPGHGLLLKSSQANTNFYFFGKKNVQDYF